MIGSTGSETDYRYYLIAIGKKAMARMKSEAVEEKLRWMEK